MEQLINENTIHNNNRVILHEHNVVDYIDRTILISNYNTRYTTRKVELKVRCKKDYFIDLMEKELKNIVVIDVSKYRGIILQDVPYGTNFINLTNSGSDLTKVTIAGSKDFINEVKAIVDKNLECVDYMVKWYYQESNDRLKNTILALDLTNLPVDEMYPWLKVPLTEYYENFLNSRENILLLIGPPGTGKTTFIRGLIKHSKATVSLSYDEKALNMDSLFINFFEDTTSNILLIEDADTHVKSRESGNELMKRFLNVADGISSDVNKKIVFSTNLPNIKDIDSALIRPGRCFDVLQFRKLEIEELNKLAKKLDINKEVNTSMILAEFFSHINEVRERSNVNSRFGFI